MHDSLPVALFRFTHLASIMNASVADSDAIRKYPPWLAFFLPWVLSNEALSHPRRYTHASDMIESGIFLFHDLPQNVEKGTPTTTHHRIWPQRRKFELTLVI
jgi:hypothetical protein